MTAENLLNTIGVVGVILTLIPIIYFIKLYRRVGDTAHFCNKQNTKIEELKQIIINLEHSNEIQAQILREQNQKLERIAQALESNDDEPYIIEKEDA